MKALGIGCLVVIGVVLALIIGVVAFRNLQLGKVQAKADAIKPGMSAGDAVKSAGDWLVIWLTKDDESGPSYRANTTGHGQYEIVKTKGSEPTVYSTQAEFLSALSQLTQNGNRWRLAFRYITVLPRQAQFLVELDEQGRVAKVTEATAED